jgi:membrane fusion protein, multidrug efflux system
VPQSAIQTDAGNTFVYAIENSKLMQKPVVLGMRGDDGEGGAVEILKGIDSGAQIVRTNLGNLRTGTTVRFTPVGNATVSAK